MRLLSCVSSGDVACVYAACKHTQLCWCRETCLRQPPVGKSVKLVYRKVVWLARPSHLIAGALRAGRDGLAAVTISSHLFSTNQMLLAGIPANSIHSLRELSHAAFWTMDSFLGGDRATRHGEDCSGLVSSLKERLSRRNLISQSARPGVDILSRFLNV